MGAACSQREFSRAKAVTPLFPLNVMSCHGVRSIKGAHMAGDLQQCPYRKSPATEDASSLKLHGRQHFQLVRAAPEKRQLRA